jgi:hypothetical protein
MRAADAGLLPHVDAERTRPMSPLQLYEYVTPIRRLEQAGTVLVGPGDDFGAAVRDALDRGRAPEPDRLAYIAANSWRRRQERLLDLALA